MYTHKILTKLPSFEVLHGTTKPKEMSPCLHLYYTKNPLGKRLQRFTKTPPTYLKYSDDITSTKFRKIVWNH